MPCSSSLRRRWELGDRRRPFSQRTLIHLSRRRSVSASLEINPTIYDQMLIVMKPNAAASDIDAVVKIIEAVGFRAHPMPGATQTAIGITGNEGPIEAGVLKIWLVLRKSSASQSHTN